MKNLFINWKTTMAGLALIATGIKLIVGGNLTEGFSSIFAGIGMIFAKDGNVTGGTTTQPSK